MSKERLEIIINEGLLESLEQYLDKNEGGHVRIIEDVSWLIERVQELEDILVQDHRQAVIESMYEENKRYREAIDVLKNKREYFDDIPSSINAGMSIAIELFEALESEEE